MARTTTFDSLKKRFQMAAGLPTLTSVDEFFFKEAVNSRAQTAWHRCQWPELLKIVEKNVSATTNPTADKAVQTSMAGIVFLRGRSPGNPFIYIEPDIA